MILRSPEFGNVFSTDIGVVISQSMDGSTIFVRDDSWPQVDKFRIEFRALSREQIDNLIRWMVGTAGQEIEYIDHEQRTWLGIITTPEPEFEQYGRGCQWKTSFEFEGVRQEI